MGVRFVVVARRPAPIVVRVQKVERGPVRDLVSSMAAGRVAALKEVTLRSEVGGTVVKLHHRRGDVVAAGEPLVTFDRADLESRMRIAELGIVLGKAQLAQAETAAKTAGSNAARAKKLGETGSMPQSEVENVESQKEAADKAIATSSAAVAQSAANAEVARIALRKSIVRAPFAGVVIETNVEEGDVVVPGGPMMSFADASALHVDVSFDEIDIGRIKTGFDAELSFDAFSDRLRGSVLEIAPSVQRDLRGNRSVLLKISAPVDPRLKIGMSVDVDVVVARRDDVAWVPPSAVMGRGAQRSVYVVEGTVAHKRAIEVGIATWEAVEVLSGIAVGDSIVVDPSVPGLNDGATVKLQAPAKDSTLKVGALP